MGSLEKLRDCLDMVFVSEKSFMMSSFSPECFPLFPPFRPSTVRSSKWTPHLHHLVRRIQTLAGSVSHPQNGWLRGKSIPWPEVEKQIEDLLRSRILSCTIERLTSHH